MTKNWLLSFKPPEAYNLSYRFFYNYFFQNKRNIEILKSVKIKTRHRAKRNERGSVAVLADCTTDAVAAKYSFWAL